MNFVVPAGHRVELKEFEKTEKCLYLAWELWNMKVTVIPIVFCTFGTVTKGLVQGLEVLEIKVRVETIQTKVLLSSARKQRRLL